MPMYERIAYADTFPGQLKQRRLVTDTQFRKSERKRKHLRKIQKSKRKANR